MEDALTSKSRQMSNLLVLGSTVTRIPFPKVSLSDTALEGFPNTSAVLPPFFFLLTVGLGEPLGLGS